MKNKTYTVESNILVVLMIRCVLNRRFWALVGFLVFASSIYLNYFLLTSTFKLSLECANDVRCHKVVYHESEPETNFADLANSLKFAVPEVKASELKEWTMSEKIEYIKTVFKHDPVTAIAIAKAEGGLDRPCYFVQDYLNRDKSHDTGVFQINSIHTKTLKEMNMTYADMKDCKKNIDFAFRIQKSSGWYPWATFNNGAYKQYLTWAKNESKN